MIDDKGVSRLWMLLQIAEISSRFPTLKAIYKSAMDDLTEFSNEHAEVHAKALAEQRRKEADEEAARQKHADGIAALKRQEEEKARQEKLAREAKYARDVLDKAAKDEALANTAKPRVIPASNPQLYHGVDEPVARRPYPDANDPVVHSDPVARRPFPNETGNVQSDPVTRRPV